MFTGRYKRWKAKKSGQWREIKDGFRELKQTTAQAKDEYREEVRASDARIDAEYARKKAQRNPSMFVRVTVALVVLINIPWVVGFAFSGIGLIVAIPLAMCDVWLLKHYVFHKPQVTTDSETTG